MPRDTLTSEQIVKAAVELLDEEGLEGLNMRALGRRLNSAATAMYWHVGSKENLLALAADQAWNEISLPDPAVVGWRIAAAEMARALYAMLGRHPWLVHAFGSFLTPSVGKLRHDDHLLAVYETAGFTGSEADAAAASVFTYVLGNALGSAAASSIARKLSRDGTAEAMMRENMAKVHEIAADFPRVLARLKTASADYASGPEDAFEFGLRALLDGLEVRITAAQARTPTEAG